MECSSLLNRNESFLQRSKNFSSQQNFLIWLMRESIREHVPDPMKSLRKNSLCLSLVVLLIIDDLVSKFDYVSVILA